MASRLALSARSVAALRSPRRPWASAARVYSTQESKPDVENKSHDALPNPDPDPTKKSASASMLQNLAPYMVATYARPPPVFVRGKGSWLWDMEGRKYLDFTAGIAVTALGHCDAEFTEILTEQAKTLVHASNLYHNTWTGALSKLLVEETRSAGGMHDVARVFVCNSGSEANEAAIKFARKVGKLVSPSGSKTEVVSFTGAFHGRTMGALSATHNPKYQRPFAPMVPGFRQGAYNDVAGLDGLVTDATCAVVVEPIQGEGGVRAATDDFLVALAERARRVGALVVHDEIQCGLGRTGRLWAHQHLPPRAHPDLLTTAKALGNGFPVGAVLAAGHVADGIAVGDHGTTFGGNPLACRLAHHMVSRLADAALLREVRRKSALLRDGLDALRARFPLVVGETRGRGLLLGLQLTEDPARVVDAARERGLLLITAGVNTLRFVPSLVISDEEIGTGVRILGEAIAATR